MSKRNRDEKTQRILNAARKVFARKGSAATMADVAAEAGLSQGLAYRYFPSKDAILTTLVRQIAESGGGPAARIDGIPGTAGARLHILLSGIIESRREQPEFYQFLHRVLADESLPNELRDVVRKNGQVIQGKIRDLIVEGQAAGEVAKDDPDQLLAAIMACLEGMLRRTELDPKGSIGHFPDARIILRMLRPDEEAKASRP
ncbi:MAG: TetR/AcrR family transcriptional regulator [Thaumarchaeota archaeon]|nr:TetR/AcrR family transcriptional regulator [Nitrososphaerota archaeon]